MKKIALFTFLSFMIISGSFMHVSAASNIPDVNYSLLTPLPTASGPTSTVNASNPIGYIQTMFELVISVAVVLAVFMLVYGGIVTMTTDNITRRQEGKRIITRTLIGFVMLLGSFLILETINPKLVDLNKFANLVGIHPDDYKPPIDSYTVTNPNISAPTQPGYYYLLASADTTTKTVTLSYKGPYINGSSPQADKVDCDSDQLADYDPPLKTSYDCQIYFDPANNYVAGYYLYLPFEGHNVYYYNNDYSDTKPAHPTYQAYKSAALCQADIGKNETYGFTTKLEGSLLGGALRNFIHQGSWGLIGTTQLIGNAKFVYSYVMYCQKMSNADWQTFQSNNSN